MGRLKKLEKVAKKPEVPVHDDPAEELRRLVKKHAAITKRAVSVINMSTDRVNRETGEVLECLLPDDDRVALQETAKVLQRSASKLDAPIKRQLRQVHIYDVFLRHVFGLGPLTAAYLVAFVNICLATKPSMLQRYCGLGMPPGSKRLDRPTRGQKNKYSKTMRTRLYLCFDSMRRTAGSTKTSKYLDIWAGYKHRMQSSPRVSWEHNVICDVGDEVCVQALGCGQAQVKRDGKRAFIVCDGRRLCEVRSARQFVDTTGWHKAADVLLEDLYTVWRTLEGLPVWPSWHAAKLGYGHGGKVVVDEPRMLTLEEALAVVGDVGAVEKAAA